jgi:para-aminobenzoate synthetase/4-amino-4-deoxychorismate lyase
LRDTAEYFAVPLQPASVEAALASAVVGATGPLRVRLLVAPDGSARTESRPHVPTEEPVRLRLACEAIDPADRFLYHKTTHRQVYERARAGVGDCDDVLLWNGAGEVTEATTANVIVEIDGRRVTPPVSSGLLAGTCRAEMLARREIDEQVVRRADLQRAGGLWVINSVHGMRAARLVD